MTDIRVRNLDQTVIALWKERASRAGRSLNDELKWFLEYEATRPRREAAERASDLRKAIRAEAGELPDAVPSIRNERDRL